MRNVAKHTSLTLQNVAAHHRSPEGLFSTIQEGTALPTRPQVKTASIHNLRRAVTEGSTAGRMPNFQSKILRTPYGQWSSVILGIVLIVLCRYLILGCFGPIEIFLYEQASSLHESCVSPSQCPPNLKTGFVVATLSKESSVVLPCTHMRSVQATQLVLTGRGS